MCLRLVFFAALVFVLVVVLRAQRTASKASALNKVSPKSPSLKGPRGPIDSSRYEEIEDNKHKLSPRVRGKQYPSGDWRECSVGGKDGKAKLGTGAGRECIGTHQTASCDLRGKTRDTVEAIRVVARRASTTLARTENEIAASRAHDCERRQTVHSTRLGHSMRCRNASFRFCKRSSFNQTDERRSPGITVKRGLCVRAWTGSNNSSALSAALLLWKSK